MQGFNPQASLLPQGSGPIVPMSGGGLTSPLGLANAEQFIAKKDILGQLSDTIKAFKSDDELKQYYESLKADPAKYNALKSEFLQKVAAAGLLSSIRVEPENTISSTHFNDTYSVKMLFKNLKERGITIDNIDIRVKADELEIVFHSDPDTTSDVPIVAVATAAGVPAAAAAAAAGIPAAAAAASPPKGPPATLAGAAAAAKKVGFTI